MKKCILSFLILLIFVASGSLFAQSMNAEFDSLSEEDKNFLMQELGYFEEELRGLSKKDLEEIIRLSVPIEEEFEIPEGLTSDTSEPQFTLPGQNPFAGFPSDVVSCFDYYEFGSVDANFGINSQSLVNGMEAEFVGHIVNKNNYPLIDGTLYVKIFKQRGAEKNANGLDVVDQFVVQKNITLKANESLPMSFVWEVPAYMDSGQYTLATFFITEDKFNFSGLSFTDDIVGNMHNFSITSDRASVVRFDKETALVNDRQYLFAAYPPRVSKEDPVTLSVDIQNNTDTTESVEVVWNIYTWDAQYADNLIETYTQSYVVDANTSKTISTVVDHNTYPVYYVVAELKYKDTKSFANIRFVRDQLDRVRLNFPSILSYPVNPGESQTIFACVHNAGTSSVVQNNTLIMTLKDTKGKIIDEYTYTGPVTGEMMAVKHEFEVSKQYTNFVLDTQLYTDGVLVDSSVKEYTCEALNPDYCPNKKEGSLIQTLLMIGGGILILLALIFFIKRKRALLTNIPTVSLVVVVLFFSFSILSPISIEAKSVTWSTTISSEFDYYWNRWDDAGWVKGLSNPNIAIDYHTRITNLDTGQVLQGGEQLPEGTQLLFEIGSFESKDIRWTGTGYTQDSPNGEWGSRLDEGTYSWDPSHPQHEPGDPVTCDPGDYLATVSIDEDAFGNTVLTNDLFDIYIKAIVTDTGYYDSLNNTLERPVALRVRTDPVNNPNSYSSLSTYLTCGEYTTFTKDRLSTICTVNELPNEISQRDITLDFHFPYRNLYFYYRYYDYRDFSYLNPPEEPGCYGNNYSMRYTLPSGVTSSNITVPVQDVSYGLTFTQSEENNPPTPPIITGPTELRSGVNGSFSFTSTDVDNDRLKYQIDWTGDGIINQTSPNTTWVTSGTSRTISKNFTTFPITFKARTLDERGAFSDWSEYTVTEKVSEFVNFIKNDSTSEPALGTMTPQEFFFTIAQALNLNQFIRPGYTFLGWATSSGGNVSFVDGALYTMVPDDTSINLFAKWNPNPSHIINFNRNGSPGSGTMNDQTIKEGQTRQLQANTFERPNLIFASWNTQSNGSGTRYADTANYTVPLGLSPNGVSATSATLFAQWVDTSVSCGTEYQEGEDVCIADQEYTYICSPDGVWDTIPTGNTCSEPIIIVCAPNPPSLTILEGESETGSVTFSVSETNIPEPHDDYTWRQSGSTQVLSEESTYTIQDITNPGEQETWTVPVEVVLNGATASCFVRVYDQNYTSTPRVPPSYYFSPNIAGTDNRCSLVLQVQDVQSCTLRSRTASTPFTPIGEETGINITSGESLPVGTYTLSCIDWEVDTLEFERTISCISNPDAREF